MPRSYNRDQDARDYKSYTQNDLEKALKDICDKNVSILQASKYHKIPYGTLHNKFNGRHGKQVGGSNVFTNQEEEAISDVILQMAYWGFPVNNMDLRMLVSSYLNQQGKMEPKFKNNLPGPDWVRSFLHRHPQLTIINANNLKNVRATLEIDEMKKFFYNLDKTCTNEDGTHYTIYLNKISDI